MRLGFIIMSQRIKLKSRQWVGPGSPRPKKFKTQLSAGKMMATVFWNAKGVIMLDFLPKRSTITDEEVVTAVEEWVNGKDPDFFICGLMALEHLWSKCITLEGNYIEKEEVDLNRK